NMPGMLALADAIGTGNVGLLLDCWHWYTSEGTTADILALRPEQVVYVHVSDAPAGVPLDEHIDNQRAMPGATGVIDIAAFLGSLAKIGFDGPVTAEPFSQELNAMENDAAAAAVSASLDAILAQAGVA
ncbi:sugar phosphate isomerase/epimerase, partial [bacterium]|nr:sugar phosphate isomerase/epimerase [bacterium]